MTKVTEWKQKKKKRILPDLNFFVILPKSYVINQFSCRDYMLPRWDFFRFFIPMIWMCSFFLVFFIMSRVFFQWFCSLISKSDILWSHSTYLCWSNRWEMIIHRQHIWGRWLCLHAYFICGVIRDSLVLKYSAELYIIICTLI